MTASGDIVFSECDDDNSAGGKGYGVCKCENPKTGAAYAQCGNCDSAASKHLECLVKDTAWKCTMLTAGATCETTESTPCTIDAASEICRKHITDNNEDYWQLTLFKTDDNSEPCDKLKCDAPPKPTVAPDTTTLASTIASTGTTSTESTCRSVGNHDVMLTCVVLRYLVLTTVRDCVGKTHGGTQARNHGGVYVHLHRTFSTDF